MNRESTTCHDCTIKSNSVSVLNKNELCILEDGCSKTTFQKGELIFKEGSPARFIAYIRDGLVKLVKKGIGGKDLILSISTKGSYLGIQNLNRKTKLNYFSSVAVTDCEVCLIDIDCFEKLLKRNGIFATEVISTIFNDEMNYFDRLVNNLQQQLPGQLANTLLYFKNQIYHENPFHLNVTRTELASLIGTTRESVTRMLKEFQKDGIIQINKNEITILNEEKMEEITRKG